VNNMNNNRTFKRRLSPANAGFTLIELMIVIGIIAVLVAVLALAVLPWLSKSAENSTKSLLQQVGGMLADEKNPLTIDRFRKDAGPLAGQISSDPRKASAQLMIFYYAPTKEAWDGSPYYKGQSYKPRVEPKEWAQFTFTDDNALALPYLRDGWDQPLEYSYDKIAKAVLVRSFGKDMNGKTDDDLVYDGRSGQVKFWDELKKK